MSSKLIIHKFDKDCSFQSLRITIEQNETHEAQFGTWVKGGIELKKKLTDKPRLVVKIVSEENSSDMNLDLCAKEINSTALDTLPEKSSIYVKSIDDINFPNTTQKSDLAKLDEDIPSNICDNKSENASKECITNGKTAINTLNLLDCSLEKVKDNNARIMKNIHMLNRTLGYAKNKEILNIICSKPLRSYPCETCGKCFVYETGLKRHCSMRHTISEMHPRWQVVWTCKDCFQVWPRQDLAIQHSTLCCKPNNLDCLQEIKTSLLLQCEFCDKIFTSIPQLLRHTKNHTITNNYECNSCKSTFTSYKTAEQHWQTCSWLKSNYTFSLPIMFICNICDRKFRNYEQLYNHRYKFSHFLAKLHNKINAKSIQILVYQCENCAHWFHAIPPLQVHKNQCNLHYESP